MKKFYNIQRILCIIPFVANAIILVCTLVELIRTKARGKYWVYFVLTCVFTQILMVYVGGVLLVYEHVIAAIITMALVYTAANFIFIGLQKNCWELARHAKDKMPPYFIPVVSGVLGTIALVIVFTLVLFLVFGANGMQHIPDANGPEDTSICSIETAEILDTSDSYKAFSYSFSRSGEKTNAGGHLGERDWDKTSLESSKLSGIITVQATRTPRRNVVLDIESSIDFGNMEIFIIVDGEVYDVIPAGEFARLRLEDIGGKLVLVRVACESADFYIEVTRKYDLRD